MKRTKLTEEQETLTSCGIGSWRPQWLQKFASPTVFMVNISFVSIVQGMATSFVFSTINTLEKRFAFDSKVSSIILIAPDIAGLLLNPLVGYYGVRFNRARLIGLGEMILALSLILCATPYFIYGPATHLNNDVSFQNNSLLGKINFQMCTSELHAESCSDNQSGNTVWLAVAILFVGNFLRGVGFTSYYVIAMPFVDDNVPKKHSPLYISIMHAVLLIGPALGFFFSSYCLSFSEDPWNDSGLSRSDPRFIGAWWLGFTLSSVLLVIAALPMFLFPAQFKTATVETKEIKKKMKERGTIDAIKRFVQNPMIMIYFFGNMFRYFGIGGYYMFLTKYIESQYRKSSSSASLITGSASIAPISLGILLGGLYICIWKPRARLLFTFVFLAELSSVFSLGSGIFLGCDPIQLNGAPGNEGNSFSLQSECNQDCHCTTQVFTPICSPNLGETYFSPCHAGCSSYNQVDSIFGNCSCLSNNAIGKGYCPKDMECNNLPMYLGMIITSAIISSTAKTGNSLITFRTVDPMDKSFTNGMIGTLLSVFTLIPFPIMFGYVIDSSCLIWEQKCGKTGNCWLYDQNKFRNRFHTLAVIFMALGSLFDLLLIFYADKIKNLYDDGGENEEINQDKTEMEKM